MLGVMRPTLVSDSIGSGRSGRAAKLFTAAPWLVTLLLGTASILVAAPHDALAVACNHYNDCDDNDPCNGLESCTLGECATGTAPDCDDHNVCTDDFCQPGVGCMNPPNR